MADTSPRRLLQRGDRDAAREAAEQLLTSRKNDPEALATLAKLAIEAGDVDGARALLARVSPKGREDYDVGLVEAMAMAQSGNAQGAELKYAELAAQRPERAEAHFGLGYLLLEKELSKEAVAPLERAVKADPKVWAYPYYLALALGSQGKVKTALLHLKTALELNPTHAPISVALGEVLPSLGLLDEAETLFVEGLKLVPDDVSLLLGLSTVRVAKKDLDGALEAAKQAVEAEPSHPGALAELARLLMAKGLFDEALELCADAEARKLSTASLYMVKAMVLEARPEQDLAGATAAYQQAMELDPHSWRLPNNLGLLLMQRSEEDKALVAQAQAALETAVARGPDRAEPKLNLAILFGREGQKVKAKELARLVAEKAQDPDHEDQAQRLLKSL